ncbi:MAG TPA: hypothetical protein VJB82_04665 [Candidatus Peribacterales bacterium]|nr:hypothetical protein [Candidatus Peribacterales bacterium]
MTFLSPYEAFGLLAGFAAAMLLLVSFLQRGSGDQTRERFLAANRTVHWFNAAMSMAVTWVWAPAVFIASLQAYTKGIAGAFWFIAPNILCFFFFAPLAIRLRRLMPEGFTLPEFIMRRFHGHIGAHCTFLFVFFGYQLGALVINALAGGILLSLLTGLSFPIAVLAMASAALSYSLISGLEASIYTDVIQMLMVVLIAFFLVPLTIMQAGGMGSVLGGMSGVTGEFGNIFHPGVAFAFGIPMTIGLLSGPFGDQMFFQRAFAVRQHDIIRTFVIAGFLFGLVPILLSMFGFIAANPTFGIAISDPQMVAPIVIAHFLPHWALLLFTLMAFSALASTIDSAYCALSSLGAIDLYQRYVNRHPTQREIVRISRMVMIGTATLGTGIALFRPELLWVFLIYGALASASLFPTILSLCWNRVTAKGAAWGVGLSLLIGLPLSIYANITERETLIVIAALVSVLIGGIVTSLSALMNQNNIFDFSEIGTEETGV